MVDMSEVCKEAPAGSVSYDSEFICVMSTL